MKPIFLIGQLCSFQGPERGAKRRRESRRRGLSKLSSARARGLFPDPVDIPRTAGT